VRRRDFLTAGPVLAFASLLASAPGGARAQEKYPSRPVRLIVPTPAGGVYDLMGRLLMDRIGPSLGTVVVENRAGGNATVGVTAAAVSAPDGYTLLLGSNSTHIFQPAMMSTPPYDPVKQFVPISTLSASWACLAVSPSLPVRDVGELIGYAKKNPRKVTSGMRGVGDVSHMTAELLKQLTGNISLQSIPYSAMAQAVRDLMTGDLLLTFPLLTRNLVELHDAGKIRLLAVTAPKRLSIAPDIPTAVESGVPGMTAAEFFYLFAPSGTPTPILQQLNDIARVALTDDEFQKKLLGAGFDPMFAGGLDETRALLGVERARWLPIAEATGMKIN
jgi:tripartite-type tricarboxylate transporter receptor subunit TctC